MSRRASNRTAAGAVRAAFAITFVGGLSLSVSFEPGSATVGVEAALAEAPATATCTPTCDRMYRACVEDATVKARVGRCYRCCKETESAGRVGFDLHPSHGKLEEHMFSACVTSLESVGHPEWFSEGFPRTYREALAYTPKRDAMAAELQRKYGHTGSSAPGEAPAHADDSACIKGCSHRPQAALKICTLAYGACRRACSPSGAKCPPR